MALQIEANPLSFAVAVLFAGSSAFLTPVGYQTNLMVYGPGGYRSTDYLRVGAPLFAIVGVVSTIGIALRWGL
ncbi:MAG: anion permease [Halanaeroarchaeum sp.]